jgi:hypothetical protein
MTGISLHLQWTLTLSRMAVFSKRTIGFSLRIKPHAHILKDMLYFNIFLIGGSPENVFVTECVEKLDFFEHGASVRSVLVALQNQNLANGLVHDL